MKKPLNLLSALNPEERQLLGLIRQGMSDEQISIIMRIREWEIEEIHTSAAFKINRVLTQYNYKFQKFN